MTLQLVIVVAASIFLLFSLFFYLSLRIARRKLKRSKYGHSFDFSRMPKQKIVRK